MDDAETVDAGVSRVFFNQSSNYVLPAFKAVAMSEAVVEHHMVHSPDCVACRIRVLDFVRVSDQAVWF